MPQNITPSTKTDNAGVHIIRTPGQFGQLVRAQRKQQGLTLEAVYSATGLTTRFLSEFERGKSNPSLGGALAAANALGLELVLVPRGDLRRLRALVDAVGQGTEPQ